MHPFVFIVNALMVRGSPVAMLQHATSSQSIVFHQTPALPTSASIPGSSGGDQFGESQPKYEYKYEVSDIQTGDRKSHWETRDGDRVRGVYTVYEPDGALRTVEYTADALHGFNAVVKRNEPTKHQFKTTPEPGYNHDISPNNIREGYEDRRSGYIPERGSYSGTQPDSQRYQSGSGNSVRFSVNHASQKRIGETSF